MRGFFRMNYSGAGGSGVGAIAFVDGKVAGLDGGGGTYTGTYRVDPDGKIKGTTQLIFPGGGTLVTGAVVPPGAPPITIPFDIDVDVATLGHSVNLMTPTGPVRLALVRISNF